MLEEPRQENCHNGKDCGYFPGGKYVYEKTFSLPEEHRDKALTFLFEGVYQNAVVYLNGEKIAEHRYGYTEFAADATGKVRTGENTLRVTVDNSLEPNCRWYTGSGIYRPVHLVIKPKDGVRPVKIRTVSIKPTVIEVQTETEHAAVEIWDGVQCVAKGVPGKIEIPAAKLWDAEHPNLYTCVVKTEKRRGENRIRYPHADMERKDGSLRQRQDGQAARRVHPPRQRHSGGLRLCRC